jgi:hypothetical protein
VEDDERSGGAILPDKSSPDTSSSFDYFLPCRSGGGAAVGNNSAKVASAASKATNQHSGTQLLSAPDYST